MGGVPCAAKIILCSPPVAQRVNAIVQQAVDLAQLSLDNCIPQVSEEQLAAVRDAMCRCEGIAEEIVKELTGPLRVCMDAIHKCDVTTKAT